MTKEVVYLDTAVPGIVHPTGIYEEDGIYVIDNDVYGVDATMSESLTCNTAHATDAITSTEISSSIYSTGTLTVGGRTIGSNATAHFQDQKPLGTDGGPTYGGDQARDMNATVHNNIAGCILNIDNTVTIGPGLYSVQAVTTMYNTGLIQASLYDSLGLTTLGIAINGDSGAAGTTALLSITAIVEVPALTTRDLRVYVHGATAQPVNGLGLAINIGPYEVFTDMLISDIG